MMYINTLQFTYRLTCFKYFQLSIYNSQSASTRNFQLATNQLATRNLQLATCNSQLIDYPDSGNETVRVVRFGSKSLSHYQTSYGPTKLELLGVVTSILDCASYLRGRKFFVECDHQALKPLFQKSLKGEIYEGWLAILQEFNFEIAHKPAESMVVCDSLSRARPIHSLESEESSPNENDPYFPFVPEPVNEILLPNGSSLQEVICNEQTEQSNQLKSVNHVLIPPTSLSMQTDNDSA